MARKIIIHIGLHKTATRFLQHSLFARLDRNEFEYNPPALIKSMGRAFREPENRDARRDFLDAAAAAHRDDGRTLVLSKPGISGDMFDNHADYQSNLAILHEAFPDAEIIYFARKPSDWLLSAYKQVLQKGKCGSIEVFLNFYEGRFQPKVAERMGGLRNLEALSLRFLDIYRAYAEDYGPERVHLFLYEDLRARRGQVHARLARLLGVDKLPLPPASKVKNRAFSALAISIFCPQTWFTPKRERLKQGLRADTKPKYHPIRWLRVLRRNLIRHGLDRLVYVNWDLLARHGMRQTIDSHYAAELAELSRIADRQLQGD